jgi:hypothetical protein
MYKITLYGKLSKKQHLIDSMGSETTRYDYQAEKHEFMLNKHKFSYPKFTFQEILEDWEATDLED